MQSPYQIYRRSDSVNKWRNVLCILHETSSVSLSCASHIQPLQQLTQSCTLRHRRALTASFNSVDIHVVMLQSTNDCSAKPINTVRHMHHKKQENGTIRMTVPKSYMSRVLCMSLLSVPATKKWLALPNPIPLSLCQLLLVTTSLSAPAPLPITLSVPLLRPPPIPLPVTAPITTVTSIPVAVPVVIAVPHASLPLSVTVPITIPIPIPVPFPVPVAITTVIPA